MGRVAIRYIHQGKAVYPDVRALKAYFHGSYDMLECSPEEAATAADIRSSVCWHMMGFYPRRLPCAVTVHDYRSLSVGRGKRIKDMLKRMFNCEPDIRIFQNESIRRALGFPEDARTYYLPMGVPPLFIDRRDLVAASKTDFIYIGSMLAERKCELMLDSFLARFGAGKTFDLYGPPAPDLQMRYRTHPNVRFRGMVAQDELPEALKSARVGVCYFPSHHPHTLQTPTKLLEYGALGLRVLANEHPQSRISAERYGLHCWWGATADMFADVPETLDWPTNTDVDPAPMAWPSVIESSGIAEGLSQALSRI